MSSLCVKYQQQDNTLTHNHSITKVILNCGLNRLKSKGKGHNKKLGIENLKIIYNTCLGI